MRYDHNTSYANRRWKRAAAAFLAEYPFCVLCIAYGKVNEGATQCVSETQRNLIVDHIVPHRGDAELFWDQENWQTLCRFPCHDKDKQAIEKASKDWWAHVRDVMRKHGRQREYERLSQWVPEWVRRGIEGQARSTE